MANAWLAHVKSTMKSHKGMKFKDVLKHAKKTYKKSGKSMAKSRSKPKSRSKKSKDKRRKRQRGGSGCGPLAPANLE